MARAFQGIEWTGAVGEPMYFRFLDHPVQSTESYASGEVNVDLDEDLPYSSKSQTIAVWT